MNVLKGKTIKRSESHLESLIKDEIVTDSDKENDDIEDDLDSIKH